MSPHPQRSPLESARLAFQPTLSPLLRDCLELGWSPTRSNQDLDPELVPLFPHLESQPPLQAAASPAHQQRRAIRCGVVFSGGPAAGGHNVLWGLFQALQTWHPGSVLIGFLNGPDGILRNCTRILDQPQIDQFRNQGGFDCLGSGRTKIETPEQLQQALDTCQQLALDGLVIIGGDDSNTNAAILAEYALAKGVALRCIGVPKTIDGDLRSADQPISFGFDTATKTYSEAIGNIARDAASARKYTHFIKLMGRSASHITLECALQTQPNLALIGEECLAQGTSLAQIVEKIVDWFIQRQAAGQPYGVILVPEGLVEFLVDVRSLLQRLNQVLTEGGDDRPEAISTRLPEAEQRLWQSLPEAVRAPLLGKRDPHGNIPLSAFETEKLLAALVGQELTRRGVPDFSPVFHFLGYEGRCGLPTDFDATLCYGLGWGAGALVAREQTGLLIGIRNPQDLPSCWTPVAIPLARLLHLEQRSGKRKPVIAKALVDLKGMAFERFARERQTWAQTDSFRQPGPVQFFGPESLIWRVPLTLESEPSRSL
jgi:pyrophosphate--fructose-6-phosphate 1-phosphotransferase